MFKNAGKDGEGIILTIGASVTLIPKAIFSPSSSFSPKIINVIFEEGTQCTSIGEYAFYDCTSLTSIIIPDSVTSIGYGAFYYCTSLKTVTIGSGVKTIDGFRGCSSLTSVTIGSGVTSIQSYALYGCTSITYVYYCGSASDWSKISIGTYNDSLTSATIYYYSETEPTEDGNYWHYVDGRVVIWKENF